MRKIGADPERLVPLSLVQRNNVRIQGRGAERRAAAGAIPAVK
jgi:hypothetical protein